MINLPVSISYIQIISDWIKTCETIFDPQSEVHQQFAHVIQTHTFFDDDKTFNGNRYAIIYLQLLFLTALSMHGGLSMPILSKVAVSQDEISLSWRHGYLDKFNFGYYNHDFKKFVSTFKNFVGIPYQTGAKIPVDIMGKCHHIMLVFTRKLMDYNARIHYIQNKNRFSDEDISACLSEDILFLILSALPSNKLADLLFVIGDIMPQDAMLTTRDGYKMKLKPYFKEISQNMEVLMEKLAFLCELFFIPDHQSIRAKAQPILETNLKTSLESDSISQHIRHELTAIQKTHIECRMGLCGIFLQHIQTLLSPTAAR